MSRADLADRVYDLRCWALARIAWCRQEEQKFGAGLVSVEAATERRALQAVLNILDGKDEA